MTYSFVYIQHHNTDPTPFVWTKSTDAIIRKIIRGKAVPEKLR